MNGEAFTVEQRYNLLKHVPLFERLGDDNLRLLAETMGIITIGAGEHLFQRGDPGFEAFVVAGGRLSATFGEGGVERARFGDGDFFGEFALFANQRRTLTVTAVEDSTLLVLPHARFETLLLLKPEMALVLLHQAVEKLASLEQSLYSSHPIPP